MDIVGSIVSLVFSLFIYYTLYYIFKDSVVAWLVFLILTFTIIVIACSISYIKKESND